MPKDTINKLTEAEARAEKIEKEAKEQAHISRLQKRKQIKL